MDRFLWGVISSPSIFNAQSTQYIIHGRLASNDANPRGRISLSPNIVRKAACLVPSSGGVGCVSPYSHTLAVCARTSVERVMTRGIASSCWEGVLREENVIFLRVGASRLLWRALLGDGRANNGAAMVVLFAVEVVIDQSLGNRQCRTQCWGAAQCQAKLESTVTRVTRLVSKSRFGVGNVDIV